MTASHTEIYGMNNHGDFVGTCTLDTGPAAFIFIAVEGKYHLLDFDPMQFPEAIPHGINDNGEIVGSYMCEGSRHGFLLKCWQDASADVIKINVTV